MEIQERINALAEYLEISPEDIKEGYRENLFEVDEGSREYLVVTEDEAREEAKESILSLIDDLGLESFTESFREWIYNNATDTGWFEDSLRELEELYVEDIEQETYDQDIYANRLIEELVDAGILDDEDLVPEDEEDEDSLLTYDGDLDSLKEEYVDYLVDRAGDPVEYYVDNFGYDSMKDVIESNNLIDWDLVADQCIEEDGIAHNLSTYDGRELDLGDGLFAYRMN